MGCRQKEQRPEENEIFIFFHKMEKDTEFNFTIEEYEKNYDIISQLSKNKFKKLEKKQSVRIGFINEIMKTLDKLNLNEREDKITRKVLFYTLVLTLTLKNFLKENENNIYLKSNNDLQQSLLTMAVQTLKNKFENNQNLKLIIYYIAKMLAILFKEMKDIDHYINIEQYIIQLNTITEHENTLEEKEIYPFLKVNLSCLGEYFISNCKENNLKLSSIKIITDYFITVIFAKTSFISENYAIYKKEIFSENYLFNINEQIIKKYDSKKRKKTISSIKNIDKIIDMNRKIQTKEEEKNYDINSSDNSSEIRKDQNFLDLMEINDSFYYFFKSIIHDVSGGKNIFEIYILHINEFITKKSNDMRVNTKLPDFNKTSEILLLLLFVKCKINGDNVILFSFLEFEYEILKKDKKQKAFVDNFVMIFVELFKDEKNERNVYDKNLKLLSNIFIFEIENQEEDLFLIEKVLNYSESFEMNDNRLELFITFLVNVNFILKESQNDDLIEDSLEKINEIFNKLNNNENVSKLEEEEESLTIKSNTNSRKKISKFMLNKEEFNFILKFCDFGKNNEKDKNEEIKKQKNSLFKIYLKYFINFLIFIENNYSLKDVYDDISSKKLFYEKMVSIITKLEIMYLNKNNLKIEELIILIKNLINITEKNTYNYLDFEIIFKFLNHNLYKLSKIEKEEISIKHFKLIYSVSIFIITQLKKIFRIPSSMQKLHNEIIQEICKNNKNYKTFLSNIDIGDFKNNSLNENHNNFYQYLINEYPRKKSNKDINNSKNIILTNKEFKNLIDLIHSKLFGKTSNLIIYFKSQGNILYDNEIENGKYKKSKRDSQKEDLKNYENNSDFEGFDNIDIEEEKHANDTMIITVNESNSNIINMSLSNKKNHSDEEDNDKEESESISKYSDTTSQNINLPERDEDENSNSSKLDFIRGSIIDNSFNEGYMTNFKV